MSKLNWTLLAAPLALAACGAGGKDVKTASAQPAAKAETKKAEAPFASTYKALSRRDDRDPQRHHF